MEMDIDICIHGVIEYRGVSGWCLDAYDVNFHRDYPLFGMLAGVNDSAFSERRYGLQDVPFTPIAEIRGLPVDFSGDAKRWCSVVNSHNWVSLREILDFDWERRHPRTALVSAVEFLDFEMLGNVWRPAERQHCRDNSGADKREVSQEEMGECVKSILGDVDWEDPFHVVALADPNILTPVSYSVSYAECAHQLWERVSPRMLKLGREYGYDNVRLVIYVEGAPILF